MVACVKSVLLPIAERSRLARRTPGRGCHHPGEDAGAVRKTWAVLNRTAVHICVEALCEHTFLFL